MGAEGKAMGHTPAAPAFNVSTYQSVGNAGRGCGLRGRCRAIGTAENKASRPSVSSGSLAFTCCNLASNDAAMRAIRRQVARLIQEPDALPFFEQQAQVF